MTVQTDFSAFFGGDIVVRLVMGCSMSVAVPRINP